MMPLLRHARYVLSENPVTGLAFGLFAMFLLAAILGPALAPYSPLQSNATMALKPPSVRHRSIGPRHLQPRRGRHTA